ncbi:hypothetical protein PGTUg99_034201 [Puccinia graminis f. sp. tritici]|uniref:Uncharacterized protein n=1 Tax=Puccinia graminis f. sp. tritici TaxID=56615 RepID=A0A5B0P1N9_PUCGR|nr:hypothetical protein PGTUg99_034201 [Puccinia graminis f. sp. tritici]
MYSSFPTGSPTNLSGRTHPPSRRTSTDPVQPPASASHENVSRRPNRTSLNPNLFLNDQEMSDTGRITEEDEEEGFEHRGDEPMETDEHEPWPPSRDTNIVRRPDGELVGLVETNPMYSDLIDRLTHTPPDDRWRISIIMMTNILQRVSIGDGEPGPPAIVPHQYSSALRTCLRRRLKVILLTGNLHAYTRTQTLRGVPIGLTPLVLLTTFLEEQTPEFRNDYLPPEWPENQLSRHSVMGLLRDLAKHERGALRNAFNRHPIHGPPPPLMDLILIVDRAMGGQSQLRSVDQILREYTPSMRIRLAYVRLEVIHHFLHPNRGSNLTQWELIDRQLEHVRSQSENYKNAYAQLIVNLDRQLFGDQLFQDIPVALIVLPTEAQVSEQMAIAGSTPRRTGGPYEGEELAARNKITLPPQKTRSFWPLDPTLVDANRLVRELPFLTSFERPSPRSNARTMNHLSGRLEYRLCDSWQGGLATYCPQPVGGSTDGTRACRPLVFSHPLKLWHSCLGRRVDGGADNLTVATCLRGLGLVVVILRGVERSTKDSTLVELPSSSCSGRVEIKNDQRGAYELKFWDWFFSETFTPTNGLPALGKVTEGQATSYDPKNPFGTLQEHLIDYLSQDAPSDCALTKAIIILGIWYKNFNPETWNGLDDSSYTSWIEVAVNRFLSERRKKKAHKPCDTLS